MFRSLFVLFCLVLQVSPAQSHKSILYIGNSYTYVNDLPGMVHDVALTFNDTLTYDSNTAGGTSLQYHSVNATTLSKIKAQDWDFVVLQAQSQEPSFPPAQVQSDTYPYAKNLNDSIKANHSCTEVVFYMTWGRKNGDASNCASYAPVCTYDGMQTRLRESYLHMADTNAATCAPAGMAWKIIHHQYPAMELYQADESHPSLYGTYLTACVFYSTLFHKSAVGAFVPAGITASDATILQTVASSTVLDSIELWHLNSTLPKAAFSYIQTGNQVSFSSTTSAADSLHWIFSDGSFTGNATAPQHVFAGSSNNSATLIAYNACGTDTFTQALYPVGLDKQEPIAPVYTVSQSEGLIHFYSNSHQLVSLGIYDVTGKQIIYIQELTAHMDVQAPAPGIYILRILEPLSGKIANQKIFVDK